MGKLYACQLKLSGSSRFGNNNALLREQESVPRLRSEHIASKQDERSSLLLLLEKLGIKKNKFETVLIVNSVLTVLFIFLNFAIFENAQARHD